MVSLLCGFGASIFKTKSLAFDDIDFHSGDSSCCSEQTKYFHLILLIKNSIHLPQHDHAQSNHVNVDRIPKTEAFPTAKHVT